MVQDQLRVPRDGGKQVMNEMARLPPRATADKHSPEAEAETARAVPVVQRHQVMLGEMAQPIHKEPNVRRHEHKGNESKHDPV